MKDYQIQNDLDMLWRDYSLNHAGFEVVTIKLLMLLGRVLIEILKECRKIYSKLI